MSTPAGAAGGLRAVLAQRAFVRFLGARFGISVAVQMQTIAVGIQVYGLTHNPLDLGLLGLSQFGPFFVLVLFAGQAADRWDRRRILLGCLLVLLLCALALLALTMAGLNSPAPVFAVMVLFGSARAFMSPATQALLPNLVPERLFAQAVGLNSSLWQLATIAGPALGGALYAAAGPGIVYGGTAVLLLAAIGCARAITAPRTPAGGASTSWHTVVEGLRFVWQRPPLLGAISMDLFAVLFGGAAALLPAYAADILHVGPAGLGWLRAAPGVGAAAMGAWLTWRPIGRRAGRAMFLAVAVFGFATITFGTSTHFWLSLAALTLLGASDMVSVFVRNVLVQVQTPDPMRGRVGAVSAMFIGASNELGEFESGLTAAWWGLEPAVVIGGLATLAVAGLWARLFPQLRRLDHFGSRSD